MRGTYESLIAFNHSITSTLIFHLFEVVFDDSRENDLTAEKEKSCSSLSRKFCLSHYRTKSRRNEFCRRPRRDCSELCGPLPENSRNESGRVKFDHLHNSRRPQQLQQRVRKKK